MMLGSVLAAAMMIGFAYIIWILAAKEAQALKITGQIISAVIAILVIVLLVYGAVAGSRMKSCGAGGMGAMMRGKEGGMMEKMMKGPGMHKMMMEKMKHAK